MQGETLAFLFTDLYRMDFHWHPHCCEWQTATEGAWYEHSSVHGFAVGPSPVCLLPVDYQIAVYMAPIEKAAVRTLFSILSKLPLTEWTCKRILHRTAKNANNNASTNEQEKE